MADSYYFEHQHGLTPNINGLTSEMQTPVSGQQKKWQNYKLLIDPQIKKGQQKLYRYDGVVPGPLGADFSVKLIRDPRSRLTRLWKGREKLDLPVPKFKYDKYYVGELPPKTVTFTNLNDNVREPFLREMCEKYGTIEDITVYHNPKTRKHLGLATVSYSSTRAARNAVGHLNRTSVMGNIIIVQVDAGGKECERIYECLVSGKVSTPSSITTTPRDPRHSGSVPPTPDSLGTPTRGQLDPRRASLEGRSSSHDGFGFPSDPQTPGMSSMEHSHQFGIDGGLTPGLSGSFGGLNVHDKAAAAHGQQMPFGQFGQPVLDQYGQPQGPFLGQHGMNPRDAQQGFSHQGSYPARTDSDSYQDPHQSWDQGYQGHDMHQGGGFSHQRTEVADPRHGYGSNQMQPPNAPQQWEQSHAGSAHTTQESNTHTSHRESRYGSHGHRTESKSESEYHSRSHHHSHRDRDRDRYRDRDRKDSYKDRHKSRHSSSLTRDSSRESTRSDRSQSPPPPAPPPPPPPPKESAKPASKEPKKEKKEDDSSTSLDLRIEQLLNQSKMSFSFDLESSQNSSTGRRDSIGSETKEEIQKEIPGSDLYEEFSDEDFEVDQVLEDGSSRDDTRDSFSSRSNDHDRSDRYRGRGYRDNSRGRQRYSPDRNRDLSPERFQDRHSGDRYRDRQQRDRDQGRHKRSRRHRWKDDRHSSERHRGRSKHSRDDSDGEYDEYSQKDKYSDRGGSSYSRRDRRSSLDREDSADSYRSRKLDLDETAQDVPRNIKRNSKDATPTEDEVQVIEKGKSLSIGKMLSNLRQSSKDSPYGVSSPAMEVSIIGTDSQGSTPLTAEPSSSALMTPMSENLQQVDVSEKVLDVPPPPPPPPQEPPVPPPQQTAGQWNVVAPQVQPPKPNQSHAQLANLAKAAAAYAQSKLRLEQSQATPAANLNIPQVPTANMNIPQVPTAPPQYPVASGAYGVTGAVQQQPGVYGTPPHGLPQQQQQQQGTTPPGNYPWMGVTTAGASPYGQHLQQHSIYHMQMMTRMGLWQQYNANPPSNAQPNMQQGQWGMQTTPGMQAGMPPSQQWMANFPPPNMQQGPNQPWGSPPGFNNQQFPMSPYGNYPQQNQQNIISPPKRDPCEDMTNDILEKLVLELKVIMKKDLCRKMVESSAFKSLENWWDECERKAKEPVKREEDLARERKMAEAAKTPEKKRPVLPHIPSLLDSSSWVKSFSENKTSAMEGLGLGLGFRATMPKMPSFKRYRKPLLPTPKKEVKPENRKEEEEVSDTEKDRREKDEESSQASEPETEETTSERRKKWSQAVSDEEEEEEDEDEDEDDEEEEDEEEEDEDEEEEEEEEEEAEQEEDEEEEEEDVDVEVEVEIEKDEEEEEEMQVDVEGKEEKKTDEKKKADDSDEESEWSESEESSASSASSSEESESEEEGEDESGAEKKEEATKAEKAEAKVSAKEKQGEDEDEEVDVEEESEEEEEEEDVAVNGEVERKEKPLERILEEDEKKPEELSSEAVSSEEKEKEPSKEVGDEISSEKEKSDKEERDMGAFELLVELATKAKPETVAEKAAAEKAKLSEDAAVPATQDKEELEAAELLQSMKTARVSLQRISSIDGLPTPERTEPSEKAATPKARKKPPPQVRIPSASESLRRRLAAGFPDLKYLMDLMSDEDEEQAPDSDVPVELSTVEEEVVGMEIDSFVEERTEEQAAEPQESGALPQGITFLDDHSYCQRPPPSPPKPVRLNEGLPLPPDISAQLPTEQAAEAVVTAETPTSVTLTAEESSTEEEKSRKRKLEEIEPITEVLPEPSKPEFELRNYYEEWSTLYKFLSEGIDHEDSYFLRKSYENLLEDSRIPWLNYTHWVPHALTNIPNPKKKRKKQQEDELNVHKSGCARTEGYYKITLTEKMKYIKKVDRLEDHKRQDQMLSSAKHSIELSREARSDQRRVIAALQAQEASSGSDLLRFNQLKFRKKELKFSKSGIHGWGLYAMENIASDEMVIEYVGQAVRQILADEREVIYGKKGIGSSYLFRIDAQQIIDATKCGNLARFINHSCNPNCYAKIITVESVKKIVIYSKQNIKRGEEITYDYKFPIEDEKIQCLCGAPQCRGSLN